jgi:hypothetical protein
MQATWEANPTRELLDYPLLAFACDFLKTFFQQLGRAMGTNLGSA